MELVRFELRDKRSPEGTLRLAIPKAYLTNRANWKGGSPQIITVRARLHDLGPLALPAVIASEGKPLEPHLNGKLTIRIWSGKENTEFERNHTRWLEKLSPGNASVKGLTHYQRVCYKEVRSPSGEIARQEARCGAMNDDHFLRSSQGEKKPFLTMRCIPEEVNPDGGCEATTYHFGWRVDYYFPRKYIDHWEEIDRRVRTLLDRFVPGN